MGPALIAIYWTGHTGATSYDSDSDLYPAYSSPFYIRHRRPQLGLAPWPNSDAGHNALAATRSALTTTNGIVRSAHHAGQRLDNKSTVWPLQHSALFWVLNQPKKYILVNILTK
jgi:hypothetical protein